MLYSACMVSERVTKPFNSNVGGAVRCVVGVLILTTYTRMLVSVRCGLGTTFQMTPAGGLAGITLVGLFTLCLAGKRLL